MPRYHASWKCTSTCIHFLMWQLNYVVIEIYVNVSARNMWTKSVASGISIYREKSVLEIGFKNVKILLCLEVFFSNSLCWVDHNYTRGIWCTLESNSIFRTSVFDGIWFQILYLSLSKMFKKIHNLVKSLQILTLIHPKIKMEMKMFKCWSQYFTISVGYRICEMFFFCIHLLFNSFRKAL